MDNVDIFRYVKILVAQVLTDMVSFVLPPGSNRDATPDEKEGICIGLLAVASQLEAYVMNTLPPDKAASVRAFLDRFQAEVQRQRSKNKEQSDAGSLESSGA